MIDPKTKIRDLTVEEFVELIERTIGEYIEDREDLIIAIERSQRNEKTWTLDEVEKKLGLGDDVALEN